MQVPIKHHHRLKKETHNPSGAPVFIPVFRWILIALVFCVVFCRSLLSFCLFCLVAMALSLLLFTASGYPLVSCGHGIVSPTIYAFWLSFGIFKLLLQCYTCLLLNATCNAILTPLHCRSLIFQCFKSRCKISLLKYTTYNTSRAVAVRRGLRFHPVTDWSGEFYQLSSSIDIIS